MKIRTFEAFAGYGSQLMALRRLEAKGLIEVEPVGISEIDGNAILAYNAVHGERVHNYGDIAKIDWTMIPDFDLLTYSFPCTDCSVAGVQKGLDEGSGTRSSLLWECRRAIITKHPPLLLMENVANLVGKKHKPNFDKWLDFLADEGYANYWQKVNAKDFGVPQNRVRVFCVSIHKDASNRFPSLFANGIGYEFPKPFTLTKRLKDVLENWVDGVEIPERYWLPEDKVRQIFDRLRSGDCSEEMAPFIAALRGREPKLEVLEKNQHFNKRIYKSEGLAPALRTATGGNHMPSIVDARMVIVANKYDSGHSCGNVYDTEGISPTVMDNHGECVSVLDTPNVLVSRRTEEGKKLRKEYEAGLTYAPRKTMQRLEPRADGVSNTLTTVTKDNLVIEPVCSVHPLSHALEFRGARSLSKEAPTIRATEGKAVTCVYEAMPFSIRRLTPKECLRLMDVSDEDIAKIERAVVGHHKNGKPKYLGDTAKYSLAGNSIVVSCLEYIFAKMLLAKEEYKLFEIL